MSDKTDVSNQRLRILEVCTVPTEKSGIPNVIFNLMHGIDKDRFQIGYVAINQPSELYRRQLDEMGARLYVIPRKLSSPWCYVARLARVARGYDIIHVHGNSATMVLEMIAARLAGVRIRAAHSHSTSCRMKKIDTCARPLFHALCNCRIACGEEAGKWLYGNRSFELIRNGVDTEKFRFNPETRKIMRSQLAPHGETLLGHVGNFLDVKHHRFLLDVFREVLNNNKQFRLVLLGEGELMEEMKTYASDLGITDKVVFAGSVDAPADYLSAIDLIVMPSKYEGFPLTLVEEQSNGLTAVVSDVVTKDVNLTGNVCFLPLEAGAKVWADEILMISDGIKRNSSMSEEAIQKIGRAGYDVRSAGNELSGILTTSG